MVFLTGISYALRTSVCYLYMMELVKFPLKETFNMFAQAMNASAIMLLAICFFVIKYGEVSLIPFCLHSIFTVVVLIRCPESPSFLHARK
jgi:hypothetical protein